MLLALLLRLLLLLLLVLHRLTAFRSADGGNTGFFEKGTIKGGSVLTVGDGTRVIRPLPLLCVPETSP